MDSKTVTELERLLDEAESIIVEFDHRLQGYRAIPSPTWGWQTADWLRDYRNLRDRVRQSLKQVVK